MDDEMRWFGDGYSAFLLTSTTTVTITSVTVSNVGFTNGSLFVLSGGSGSFSLSSSDISVSGSGNTASLISALSDSPQTLSLEIVNLTRLILHPVI
jgi:hypothetical protein